MGLTEPLCDRDTPKQDACCFGQQRCSARTSGRDRSGSGWVARSKLRSPFHGLSRTAPHRRCGERDAVAVATIQFYRLCLRLCRSCRYTTRFWCGNGLNPALNSPGGVPSSWSRCVVLSDDLHPDEEGAGEEQVLFFYRSTWLLKVLVAWL